MSSSCPGLLGPAWRLWWGVHFLRIVPTGGPTMLWIYVAIVGALGVAIVAVRARRRISRTMSNPSIA